MRKKNILVITYWSLNNALIQTYTLPYVRQIIKQLPAGSKIYLFVLSDKTQKAESDKITERLKTENIYVVEFLYTAFGLAMAVKMLFILPYLIAFALKKNIKYIHAWCTPGGAIGYFVSAITRIALILDSFEPHAETMVEGETWAKNSFRFKILFALEKLQLKRAKEVICAAPEMASHSQKVYRIIKPRYFVKPACVDLDLFSPTLIAPTSQHITTCVYAGKFGGIYLEQEVFDFFKVAYDFWQTNFKVLLLTSHSDMEIMEYCKHSGFPFEAVEKKFVKHIEVPGHLATGDFGICPVKPLPSKKYCSPIKNGEYWAMGLPVVITQNISNDSDIIEKENIGYVLKSLDAGEYLKAVQKIDQLMHIPKLNKKIRSIAVRERNFSDTEKIYAAIYGTSQVY